MIFTPASTRSSATSWARVGTASTPTTTSSSRIDPLEVVVGRTVRLSLTLADLGGSLSNRATTRKPWSAKMSEPAIAWPRLPAPNRAMLCLPVVRRILRICETSESTLYPTRACRTCRTRTVAADLVELTCV